MDAEIAKMNAKLMLSSNLRRVARGLLRMVGPTFLNLVPVQWFWRRKEPIFLEPSADQVEQDLEDHEYSVYSQNGEDGIIRYLFSQIGVSSRLFLEFGFGVIENNTLRLVLSEGWRGVLIDGCGASVRAFNKAMEREGIADVKAVHQFLNLENLRQTILESGVGEHLDLLSIDVDGNDYWFWNSITYLNPRVVVIEYNASLGSELSITVPYDPLFDRHKQHLSGFYHGASLAALTKLGNTKGYGLVGCDSNGVNAFFVRNDCLTDRLRAMATATAYRPHRSRLRRGFSGEYQFNLIRELPYTRVD